MNINRINWNKELQLNKNNIESGTSISQEKERTNENNAVVVNISNEGLKKAHETTQTRVEIYYSEDNAKTTQTLMDEVKNGEVLTLEEEERLNRELKQMIQEQYERMQNLRLSDDDERVLKALKNNFLMKQRTLADMQKRIETEKTDADIQEQKALNAENAQEVSTKNSEIRMLEESLGQEKEDSDESQNIANKNTDREEKKSEFCNEHNQIMAATQKQDDAIADLKQQKNDETDRQYQATLQLDEDYERTMSVFEEDDFSLLEKLETYEKFKTSSYALAVEREIARHEKIYDHESIVDAKIIRTGEKLRSTESKAIDNLAEMGQTFIMNNNIKS